MGNCFERLDIDEPSQEDQDTRRQRQAEAALKRQQEAESRGIKDPERLKAKQARKEQIEKNYENAQKNQPSGTAPLKWTVD